MIIELKIINHEKKRRFVKNRLSLVQRMKYIASPVTDFYNLTKIMFYMCFKYAFQITFNPDETDFPDRQLPDYCLDLFP